MLFVFSVFKQVQYCFS